MTTIDLLGNVGLPVPNEVIEVMGQVFTTGRGASRGLEPVTPLRVAYLHYPGDGLHFIEAPRHPGHAWLDTPEAQGRVFRGKAEHNGNENSWISQGSVQDFQGQGFEGRDIRGRGRLSVGPVMLYAEIFIDQHTSLSGIEAAYRSTYPTSQPPICLTRKSLIKHYILNIYPISPGTNHRSIGLWSDLIDHGLGQLAETMALAAQDRSYRRATGQSAPPPDRRSLVQRIRALSKSPLRPARTLKRVEPGRDEVIQ